METELGLYGNYKVVPENFNKSLILSDIKLKWNQNTRSFRYHGPVGVIRVGNHAVNKEVEAYIELSKRGSGDLLDIYFWYWIKTRIIILDITREVCRLLLRIKHLTQLFKLKGFRQKTKRLNPDQPGYIYALAPDRRVELFFRRYMDADENG